MRVTAGRRLSVLPPFSAVQLLCNGYFSTKEKFFSIEEVFDYLDNEAFILIGNLSCGCYGSVVFDNRLLIVCTSRIGMVSLFKM